MYELDNICQGVCTNVLKMQGDYSIGDSFIIPDTTKPISFIYSFYQTLSFFLNSPTTR